MFPHLKTSYWASAPRISGGTSPSPWDTGGAWGSEQLKAEAQISILDRSHPPSILLGGSALHDLLGGAPATAVLRGSKLDITV